MSAAAATFSWVCEDGVRRNLTVDQLWFALRLPRPAFLTVPISSLFFVSTEITAALHAFLRLIVDVFELRVAIRMLRALDGLGRRLEAVPVLATVLSLIRMLAA